MHRSALLFRTGGKGYDTPVAGPGKRPRLHTSLPYQEALE